MGKREAQIIRHLTTSRVAFCPAHDPANVERLIEAVKAQHEAIDILFARLINAVPGFYPSESGKPWEAAVLGNAALKAFDKHAEGGE